MVNYDETTETKASSTEAAAAYCGLSLCSSGSSDSTADCCSPPPSPKSLLSVEEELSINSSNWDHHPQDKEGLRHRHRGKVILTDMTPALQQSVRQRPSSSVTTTPPDSPLHLLPPCNVGNSLDEEGRFLLPQSALLLQSSHRDSSSSSSSYHHHRHYPAAPRRRFWVRTVWILHIAVCVLVIFISVWSNQDSRKYIIIDPHKVDATCKRVFLNVMASSPDEKDSIVCCEPLKSGGGKRRIPKSQLELEQQYRRPTPNNNMNMNQQQQQDDHYNLPLWINQHVLNRQDDIYEYDESTKSSSSSTTTTAAWTNTGKRLRQQFLDICPQPRATRVRLPFVNRLAKFPDAWLLPLFPLLIRICLRLYQSYLEPESPTPSSALSSTTLALSSRRQPFYARYYYNKKSGSSSDTTFGIYTFRRLLLYFMIMLFRGAFLFMALNGIEDQIAARNSTTNEKCWYSSLLKESQPDCYGRIFDFSDHIVLYFAQLLPIALLEYLHSLERPYWPFRCFRKRALPVLLTCAMLYLYALVFVGVYKTASYFHTTSEITAGFGVSLIGSLPLGWVQCSESPRGRALRYFFFGRGYNYEKSSPSISASSLTPP